jgi:hypothetical protein
MMPSLSTIKPTRLLAAILAAVKPSVPLAAALAALAPVPVARADTTQESTFQDDAYLVDSSSAVVYHTLAQLASLGVTRVRVNVKWSTIAPNPTSRTMPAKFNPLNPADYPAASWVPYDRLVVWAAAYGIGVDFNITAPGPLWAMAGGAPTKRAADHWYPDAQAFGDFVYALGARYSGSYSPPALAATDPSTNPVTKLLGGLTGGPPSTPPPATPLPRVDYWSVWNEPNQPGWLAPQWRSYRRQQVLNSPRLYRQYVDAAYGALASSGHRSDTVLVGELAPEGYTTPGAYIATTPLPFLRALYCVDSRYRRLRGNATAALGCPTSGTAKGFIRANPGLFYATGFAHHPYYFYHPPAYRTADSNYAPLANLSRLEHGVDRALAAYGVHRRLPIYITEYGYSTNPPNPREIVTPAEQAAYINQADYMAWRDPRVRSVSQFLLYDSGPDTSVPKSSLLYWDTFQTGLLFANGRPKPAYNAYRTPIWIPSPRVRRGARVLIWGQIRPGPHDVVQAALVQWRARHGRWSTVATVQFEQPEGYFTARVRPPGSGILRIAWRGAGGVAYTSRTVTVTVR